MLKKIARILLIITGSLMSLLLLLVLVVRMGILNDFIAGFISKQAGKNLNGRLTIERISGNLLSSFTLHNISMTYESDTLFQCGEIGISYRPEELLKKKVDIDKLYINNLSVNLVQDQDSVWNFTKLMKKGKTPDADSTGSDWKISVNDLRLKNFISTIDETGENNTIPSYIESALKLKAFYSSDSISVNLDSLGIITKEPDFNVFRLSGRAVKEDDVLKWMNVRLKLANSLALSNGKIDLNEEGNTELTLDLEPVSFEDVSVFIPGLKIYGNPSVSASIKGNSDRYDFNLNIAEENQGIELSGYLKNFRSNPEYAADLIADNLDGSFWTHDNKLKSDISGKLSLHGEGFDYKKNDMELQGKFNLIFGDYSVDDLQITASKMVNKVTGSVSIGAYAGRVDVKYKLDDLFGNPAYDLYLRYSNINLDKIPGADSIITGLNGDIRIKGRGVSPEKTDAVLSVRSEESEIFGELPGDLTIDARYSRGDYDFILSVFNSPYFLLDAAGHGNIRKENNVSFTLYPVDPSKLLSLAGIPDFKVSGKITGYISGQIKSLAGNIYLDLNNIKYDTISINKLDARLDATLAGSNYDGSILLNAAGLAYGAYTLRSVDIIAGFSEKRIEADLKMTVSDSLEAFFNGVIEGFENPLITIRQLGINYQGTNWITGNDTASIMLAGDHMQIRDFSLVSGSQSINARGRFAFKGEENFTLDLLNIDLQTLPLNDVLPFAISGLLNSRVRLTGTSLEPVLECRLDIDDMNVKEYYIDSIRTDFSYKANLLSFSGKINTNLEKPVILIAALPVHISLNDSIKLLKNNPGLSASVQFDSLDLKKVFSLFPVKNTSVEGFASLNAEIRNNLNDPVITGKVNIQNGSFKNTEFGMNYNRINIRAGLADERIGIDEFTASARKGTLNISGYMNLNKSDSLAPADYELSIKASEFQALESNLAELNLSSDIKLTGPMSNSKFSGEVKVNKSKMNIDYLGARLGEKTIDPDPPLLIRAMRDTVSVSVAPDTAGSGSAISGSDLYKHLAGEVVLNFPGNTWITGKDMNIELEGSVRAVKSAEKISLFGDLNIKRGSYKLYGRNFNFSRGKLTFTGASELNPQLDFEIIYSFRDIEKELRNLKLLIKGRMLQPEFEFRLDDEVLEEKDAISYLVFGKSVNQLGEGERDKLSGENIAMGVAVTQLSSVLKGVLQESAGVDVFEVTGGEDWKSGSVTIGKYITNKLFLSYDRSFDFNKQSKTANTEKIMLEYQLLRNLLLKATNQEINSGFDLIFRRTWR